MVNLKPNKKSDRSNYVTRNIEELDPPRCKTESYAKSFLPQVTKLWNSLPQDMRDTTISTENFKYKLKDSDTISRDIYLLVKDPLI